MSNPDIMKDQLIKMDFREITKSFIIKNFCQYFDENSKKLLPSVYNFTDKITLAANEFHNKEKITTTLGRLLTNKFLFSDELFPVVGYVNKTINGDVLKDIESKISDGLLSNKITPEIYSRYYNRVQWLSLSIHTVVCSSFTPKTIGPLPEVLKLKEQLIKKYDTELKGPNAVIYMNKIEQELLHKAEEILKDDTGMSLYKSKARGSFGNNYKNMNVIKGPTYNTLTKKFDFVETCLTEGIKKEDIPSWGNMVIAGAYPKAIGTAVAGYYTKKFFACYQTSILGPENSDCGSKMYLKYELTEKNYKKVKYRWILDGKKLVCLTPEIAPKYYGKTVLMRSPLYCKSRHICSKCAGDLYYRLKVKNIGLTVADISTSYLNKLMKSFHSSVVDIYKVNPKNMFL